MDRFIIGEWLLSLSPLARLLYDGKAWNPGRAVEMSKGENMYVRKGLISFLHIRIYDWIWHKPRVASKQDLQFT